LAVGRKGKKNKYESKDAEMENPSFHSEFLLSFLKKFVFFLLQKRRKINWKISHDRVFLDYLWMILC
jgi:hypothetical protein